MGKLAGIFPCCRVEGDNPNDIFQHAMTTLLVSGLSESGKTRLLRCLKEQAPETFIVVNDTKITGFDPELRALEKQCAGTMKKFLDDGCLCCDDGNVEKLLGVIDSPSQKNRATEPEESQQSRVVVVELSGATDMCSLAAIPHLRRRLNRSTGTSTVSSNELSTMITVAVINAASISKHISSQNRPSMGAKVGIASLLFGQIEQARIVLLNEYDLATGRTKVGSAHSTGDNLEFAYQFVRAINPEAEILRVGSLSDLELRQSKQPRKAELSDTSRNQMHDAAASIIKFFHPASITEGFSIGNRAEHRRQGEEDSIRIRRAVFCATKPFHPTRFSKRVIQLLHSQNGSSAFDYADQALSMGDKPESCWTRCLYLRQEDCWMASQPRLRFFLRFTGCVFRLEEKAQDEEEEQSEEGDYTPTSALVSSNAESQPAVDASGSYSLLPQPQSCQQGNGNSSTDSLISHLPTRNSHQMHQSMIIVVIGSASDLSVCLAELEACLLNREEMDAYTKRVAAAPPSS